MQLKGDGGSTGRRRKLTQRFAYDRFGRAILRHFEDHVGLLLVPAGSRGLRSCAAHVLDTVNDEEEHPPFDGSSSSSPVRILLLTGTGERCGASVFISSGRVQLVARDKRHIQRWKGRFGTCMNDVVSFLFELGVDEERRERQRLVLRVVQADVPIARPQVIDGYDSLGRNVIGGHVGHGQPKEGQITKEDGEFKFVVKNGIDSVALDHFGFVFDAIGRNANDLDIQQRTASRRIGWANVLARYERQFHVEDVKAVELFAPRVEASVHDVSAVPHQGRLQDIATAAHLFEKGRVQVKGSVFRLVVERHHLDAKRPEENRIEIGRIDPHSGGVRPQQLRFRVAQNRRGLFAT